MEVGRRQSIAPRRSRVLLAGLGHRSRSPPALLGLWFLLRRLAGLVDGQVEQQRIGGQDHSVVGLGEQPGDLFRNGDLPKLDEAWILLHSGADHLRRRALTLGVNNRFLLLLLRFQHQVPRTLRVLLSHLFRLYCLLVVWAEIQVCDRHIVQENMEVGRALHESLPDHTADLVALHDELRGVVLRHHALQHLVDDGREHLLVEVRAQDSVDLRQPRAVGLAQDTDVDIDHLQVAAAGQGRHGVRPRAGVEDDGPLEPRDHEMKPLLEGLLADPGQTAVLDGHVAGLHRVESIPPEVRGAPERAEAHRDERPAAGRQALHQLLRVEPRHCQRAQGGGAASVRRGWGRSLVGPAA
mmetsp:Transcript_63106/g.176477  ORF Transcript_63106/g.176477 Transcript_63106/m.176477 type:complete len:353 (+) Transcript_63106:260-1318(+)